MVSVDIYFKGFTAVFAGVFAALLLFAARGKPAPWSLGVFFLLIGANQGFEIGRTLATDPGSRLAWFRAASVVAALDPVALYWFTGTLPGSQALRRLRWAGPVVVVGAGLALFAGWGLGLEPAEAADRSAWAFPMALTIFTLAVYASLLAWAVHRLRSAPGADGWGFMVPALTIATLPPMFNRLLGDATAAFLTRGSVAGQHALFLGDFFVSGELQDALGFVLVALAGGVLVAWVRRDAPHARRIVLGSVIGGLAFTILMFLVHQANRELPGLTTVGRSENAVRWVIFGVFASIAIFRGQVAGWSVHARRRAARVFLAAAFLLVAGLAVLALRAAVDLTLVDAGVLLVALALSQGFGKLVDQVALRLYGGAPARERPPGPVAPGGVVMDRYHVRRLLGRGGAGKAFLAQDELLDREVVLKEVFEDGSGQEDAALREARIGSRLQHPNVVVVHDVLPTPSGFIIVSEHVAGGSLEAKTRAAGPLPVAQGLRMLDGVLAGLEAAHANGVIHRDLKPANILLLPDGTPKIADFGVARVRSGATVSAASAEAFRGTPEFMAPEQRRGEVTTPATDVYAVGLLARRCIAHPLPASVERVVAKALVEAPDERWASAADMRAALPPPDVIP